MDFDPASGRLFAYADAADTLLEIDTQSGEIRSVTDLEQLLVAAQQPVIAPFPFIVWAGFAFNEDGSQIFLSRAWDVFATPFGGETLLVLDREIPDCFVVTSFVDLGEGLPGVGGVTPQLTGEVTSDPCDVELHFTSTSQSGNVLVIGLSEIDAPFKGGLMVPSPDTLLPDAFGASDVLFVDLGNGVLNGLTLYMQVWVEDPAGPSGYSASNGLSMAVR
jgi:hypothetical protein